MEQNDLVQSEQTYATTIHCPVCGKPASRCITRSIVKTACPQCDYLTIIERESGKVIESFNAPGLIPGCLSDDFVVNEVPSTVNIEICPQSTLGGAKGAYSSETQTIYFSEELLKTADAIKIAAVLLEEFGHYLDSIVSDFSGDEGNLFASMVTSKAIDIEDEVSKPATILKEWYSVQADEFEEFNLSVDLQMLDEINTRIANRQSAAKQIQEKTQQSLSNLAKLVNEL